MPKYYISTGGHQEIVVAETREDAATEAIRRIVGRKAESLGLITHISELGFEMQEDDEEGDLDWWMATDVLLDRAGLGDLYSM